MIRNLAALAFLLTTPLLAEDSAQRFIQVQAKDKFDRSAISDRGMSIESTYSDSVWGFATDATIQKLTKDGFKILGENKALLARPDFPSEDERFRNYDEIMASLKKLKDANSDIISIESIGKTIEDRDIWAIHISTDPEALATGQSNKPGVVFMGAHHAREHVSSEIPLMMAEYLLEKKSDTDIAKLLDTRDIWFIPLVNPDGSEYDIEDGDYRLWRKNRRKNGNGTRGVDLNRNYGYKWGTGGSSSSGSSDIYKGPEPFSEPETQAIRDFVMNHANLKVLLSFHTFSELILYPWGHKYDPISKADDLEVFETMAKTMAKWNKYTPQQSSDLYIASGDTTDWAYGERGIFAFTFELSPKTAPLFQPEKGFYPGAKILDGVFAANLKPVLYMIDVADDPYKVVSSRTTGFLKNYVEPRLDERFFWETHPLH